MDYFIQCIRLQILACPDFNCHVRKDFETFWYRYSAQWNGVMWKSGVHSLKVKDTKVKGKIMSRMLLVRARLLSTFVGFSNFWAQDLKKVLIMMRLSVVSKPYVCSLKVNVTPTGQWSRWVDCFLSRLYQQWKYQSDNFPAVKILTELLLREGTSFFQPKI